MNYRWHILLAVIFLPLFGQSAESRRLTLEEWLVEATPHHPALLRAEADVEARRLRSEERVVWEDPELRIGNDERPGTRDQTFVSLRFPIPNLFEEDARSDESAARLDLARAEHRAARRIVREDLGRLYLEAVSGQALLRHARQRKEAMEAELARAREMLKRQRMTRQDVLEMQIDLADAVVELAELEDAASAAESRMREYLPDLPPDTELELLPAVVNFEGDPPPVAGMSRRIQASDPELSARLAAVRAATAAVSTERARRIPFPTFAQGTWTRDHNRDQDEWEFRVGISVPLFTWIRGTDPRERAELLIAQSDAGLRRREVAGLAERIYRDYASSLNQRQALEELLSPVLDQIRQSLDEPGRQPRPDQRLELADDRYRLQRDLLRAELDYQLAAWALHTLVWNWEPAGEE